MTAAEASALIQAKKLSCEELTRSCLARIRARDPVVKAWLSFDPDHAIAVLETLKAQGMHICIDDFGTGYSSLSYLKRLPVETIKIDRSFVDGLGQDQEDTAIVRAVIGIADSLRLLCVAEGVETEDQVDALRVLGCHIAQGFLFGRPRSVEQLAPFPRDDLSSWVEAPVNQ